MQHRCTVLQPASTSAVIVHLAFRNANEVILIKCLQLVIAPFRAQPTPVLAFGCYRAACTLFVSDDLQTQVQVFDSLNIHLLVVPRREGRGLGPGIYDPNRFIYIFLSLTQFSS